MVSFNNVLDKYETKANELLIKGRKTYRNIGKQIMCNNSLNMLLRKENKKIRKALQKDSLKFLTKKNLFNSLDPASTDSPDQIPSSSNVQRKILKLKKIPTKDKLSTKNEDQA